VPLVAFVALALVLAYALGEPVFGRTAQPNVGWMTQFVLGNTTHVVLTFVLLGVRTDVLRATAGQARLIGVVAAVTFVATILFLLATQIVDKNWQGFGIALLTCVAVHHYMKQARGIWSLLCMREGAPPSAQERTLQEWFMPVSAGLIILRMLFVPLVAGSTTALLQPVPAVSPDTYVMLNLLAQVPYETTYILLGLWVLFTVKLFRGLLAGTGELSGPKLLYVAGHTLGVAVTLFRPGWGMMLVGGIHGLEYFALTGRMLQPRDETESSRFSNRLVVPAMIAAMIPFFAVGILNAPFAAHLGIGQSSAYHMAAILLNGVVVAHYATDRLMYRFRIPGVRAVALRRLGFVPR
jgi:hypothetical protein